MFFKSAPYAIKLICMSSCIITSKNKSSIDLTFVNLMIENKNLSEQNVAKFLPILGFVLELIFEICGILLVYYIINFLAPIVVGENYNNNFLYSMLLLPVISSLKKLPEIFKSVFVRIAISDDFIICKRGYFRKFIDKLYIKHIDNIEIRTTIWGEWFNYGTIDLYSYGGKISLPFLKNPCDVYFSIRNKIVNKNFVTTIKN